MFEKLNGQLCNELVGNLRILKHVGLISDTSIFLSELLLSTRKLLS